MSTDWRTLIQRTEDVIITRFQGPLEALYRTIKEQHGKHKDTRKGVWVPDPYIIYDNLILEEKVYIEIRKIVGSQLSDNLCFSIWQSLKKRMALMDEVYAKLAIFFGTGKADEFVKLTNIDGCEVLAQQNVTELQQQQYKKEVLIKCPNVEKSISLLVSQKNTASDILAGVIINYIGSERPSNFHQIKSRVLYFAVVFNLPTLVAHLFTIANRVDKLTMLDIIPDKLFQIDYFTNNRYLVFQYICNQFIPQRKRYVLNVKFPAMAAARAGFDFIFYSLADFNREDIQHFLGVNEEGTMFSPYLYNEAIVWQHYPIAEIIFTLYNDDQRRIALRHALMEAIKSANDLRVCYLGNIAKNDFAEIVKNILNTSFTGNFRTAVLSVADQTIAPLDVNKFVHDEEWAETIDNGAHQYKNMYTYLYQKLGQSILLASDCFLFRLAAARRSFSGLVYLMSIAEPHEKTQFLEILGIDNAAWETLAKQVNKKINDRKNARQFFSNGVHALDRLMQPRRSTRTLFQEQEITYEEMVENFKSAYITDREAFNESVKSLRLNFFKYSKKFVSTFEGILLEVEPHLTLNEFTRSANMIKRELRGMTAGG